MEPASALIMNFLIFRSVRNMFAISINYLQFGNLLQLNKDAELAAKTGICGICGTVSAFANLITDSV